MFAVEVFEVQRSIDVCCYANEMRGPAFAGELLRIRTGAALAFRALRREPCQSPCVIVALLMFSRGAMSVFRASRRQPRQTLFCFFVKHLTFEVHC